jgi:hypothetical protein
MKLKDLFEGKYGSDIDLAGRGLSKLPPDLPHSISGNFQCNDNDLTTLEGCPSQVGGYFWCHSNDLTTLKGCPSVVGINFWCQRNMLTSLEGCPSQVGGDFMCDSNLLTSLEGCPSQVGGDFWCHHNSLTSLDGCPSQVSNDFVCYRNKLISLKDVHKHITKIGGGFECYNNPIQSHILGLMMIDIGGEITTRLGNGTNVDEVLNKWKNQGRKGVLGCQRDLIAAGYKELAQL